MKDRKFMPFYWAVQKNCSPELSQRIEKLLGDCLPENFVAQSGKISEEVTELWTFTLNNPVNDIKQSPLFKSAQAMFKQYVEEYTLLINKRKLRIIDRLAVIQLVQACWAFPAIADICDLDAFLAICEKHQKSIF